MRTIGTALVGLAAIVAGPASGENPMKACGAKYRAARAAGTLGNGETWNGFLKTCRASMPMASAEPAAAKPAGVSPAQLAARERMKTCSTQWKADKAAGKTGDRKWSAYWSACSARFKANA